MNILVFSDTHLTDQFDEKKYQFLSSIISRADQVIINGDFWEGKEITFDQFMSSKWSLLFPLLKSKQAIYLFGNHDPEHLSDERVNAFSSQHMLSHKMDVAGIIYHIEHGHGFHTILSALDKRKFNKNIMYIHQTMERFLTRYVGTSVFHGIHAQISNQIKRQRSLIIPDEVVLITGHTHAIEYDKKYRYINTGFSKYGIGQYLMFKDGTPRLFSEWYDKPSFSFQLNVTPPPQLAFSYS